MDGRDQQLKYLGFVRMMAINAIIWVVNLYECVKLNSGPLKFAIGIVESAVTTVVGPVYERFKAVPAYLLVFLDAKVDEAANKFNDKAPPFAKQLVNQTQYVSHKLSNLSHNIDRVSAVGGLYAAIYYISKLYKEMVLTELAKVWYGVNQIFLFNVVAKMVVPTVAHLSQEYNNVILKMVGKDYVVFGYFPLVPVDDMAKAYKQVKAAKEGMAAIVSGRETELVG